MIELKDFIKATLRDIIEAVSETQEAFAGKRAIVNPGISIGRSGESIQSPDGVLPVERVEFDVAVVEAGLKEAGGGAKVKVFSVGADAGGRLTSSSEATSRVKFSIPIVLPSSKPPQKQQSGIFV